MCASPQRHSVRRVLVGWKHHQLHALDHLHDALRVLQHRPLVASGRQERFNVHQEADGGELFKVATISSRGCCLAAESEAGRDGSVDVALEQCAPSHVATHTKLPTSHAPFTVSAADTRGRFETALYSAGAGGAYVAEQL